MKHEERHSEFESKLLELHEAEVSGVFQHTFVNAESLLAEPETPRHADWFQPKRIWFSAAACLFMAVGIGTLMFQEDTLRPTSQPRIGNVASTSGPSFQFCFTGPGGGLPEDCSNNDFDGDGDVDLADFRIFQAQPDIYR